MLFSIPSLRPNPRFCKPGGTTYCLKYFCFEAWQHGKQNEDFFQSHSSRRHDKYGEYLRWMSVSEVRNPEKPGGASVANDERPYFNNPSIYFLTSAPLPWVKSFPPLKSAPLANFARSLPLRPRPLPPLVQRVMSFLPDQFWLSTKV